MHLLLNLFTSQTMATAAAGSRSLLLYRRSKLVSQVRGVMARSGDCVLSGAARILTQVKDIVKDQVKDKATD